MEPDLEYMSIQSLQVLNNSLMKIRNDAVAKLHALQKTNHDLVTENTRLRQHAREHLKRQHERLLMQNTKVDTTMIPKRFDMVRPVPPPAARTNPKDIMSITLQIGFDFTAIVETKIALSPAQLKEYFDAEATAFQYTMILIEIKQGVVENASTIVTKNAKVTLRKLQNEMMYHITVHCTVPDGQKRLTRDIKFVYNQRNATYRQCQKEQTSSQPAPDEPLINVNVQTYTLNVQMGEEEYITCKFGEGDDHEQVARDFIGMHKLKPILLDGILAAMQELISSNVTIKSVDVADLL